eukprot:6654355-Karenia_brevis.AAC.1
MPSNDALLDALWQELLDATENLMRAEEFGDWREVFRCYAIQQSVARQFEVQLAIAADEEEEEESAAMAYDASANLLGRDGAPLAKQIRQTKNQDSPTCA